MGKGDKTRGQSHEGWRTWSALTGLKLRMRQTKECSQPLEVRKGKEMESPLKASRKKKKVSLTSL